MTHTPLRIAPCALLIGLMLSACTDMKPGPGKDDLPGPTEAPAATAPADPTITMQTPAVKAYRKIGARYIYTKYPKRIYKGKIPPLVYAVVVVETHVEADGTVSAVTFSRTPSHAPEVPPMIADLIKATSPLPNPGKVGAHTYVETWLWDKSGNFQLDTLTLGQRSR
ncbi:hypothetical protein QTI66_15290 [Variovorax sp. J22R133]|uniref:hypothetical protein n=1 Tax=Variovorax brevis TaxID=3053503 RepID=UPI002574C8DE|nr:hypothetical protein [Variovorax sp. J22R133]MDM0113523.1 hypothetical protein [Variovorax sp. J22R133]